MSSLATPGRTLALLCAAIGVGANGTAQEQPLQQNLVMDATSRFRIQLTVRTEVRGDHSERIGAKTYVKPFVRAAEAGLSWRATRRVVSIDRAGLGEIEETLGEFEELGCDSAATDENSAQLRALLRETLSGWKGDRTLRYREARDGQVSALSPDGVPLLGEDRPVVLTLWLLRALRPAVAFPNKPLRIGERWEEPRVANLQPWSDVKGSESGEWLTVGAASEPVATLHVVQQIRGNLARPEASDRAARAEPNGRGEAAFYAESLGKVSLLDASLISATRSASREIRWTLVPVEGLQEPPEFQAKLSATVTIHRLP